MPAWLRLAALGAAFCFAPSFVLGQLPPTADSPAILNDVQAQGERRPAVALENLTLEQVKAITGIPRTEGFRENMAPILKEYKKNKQHKALAVAVSEDNKRVAMGLGRKAPSEAMAAQVALQGCEQDRQQRGVNSPCEIILANDQVMRIGKTYYTNLDLNSPSLVWQVQGAPGTVYLAGTIHVLKPSLFPLPPVFDQVFEASDQVVLEVNPLLMGDPERLANIQQAAAADPKALKAALPKELRKRLRRYAKAQGLAFNAALTAKPMMLATQIAQLKLMALGYSGDAGLDMHYARRASAAGKPLVEIENYLDTLGLLTNLPLSTQFQALDETIRTESELGTYFEQMLQLWLAADVDAIYELTKADTSMSGGQPDFHKQLLDDRNLQMFEKIQAYLAEPKTTLVMVGAAHMGGPVGLLRLLADNDYTAKQLPYAGL